MAVLKRWKFAARSEGWHGVQGSLLEETIEADLEAIAVELGALRPSSRRQQPKDKPKRSPLPAHLPRVEVRHEPEQTTCGCGSTLKRIGEDVSEKLDYTPGVFHVERHIRGKWACAQCQTLIQAPVPAQVIDKGMPTAGLLAQVLVAKYADHQPLYRQEAIFERAGLAIPRSTLAQWVGACGVQLQPLVDALRAALLERSVLHADETPVAMLDAGQRQDASGLHLELQLDRIRRVTRGRLRLRATVAQAPIRKPSSKAGRASSCATTTRVTRHCSPADEPRLVALRMRAGSSTTCGSTTRARWPRKR